ncbi:MAG: hypothetical protein KTV77_05395 [Wolbachia endosymbiont of Fragariocoptes setiger]|nr:hypothetical protein [Wolbachia endosymbiont of Fragariocoptes setiger]
MCYIKVDVNDIANRYVDPRRARKIAIAHNKIINKIEENISCGLNLIEREIINAEVLSHDLNLIHGIAKSLYKGFKHAKNDDKIQLTGKLKNNTFIVCICNNKVITEDTCIYKEKRQEKYVCLLEEAYTNVPLYRMVFLSKNKVKLF